MTYDQYWHGDCDLVRDYRQAEEIRNRRFNSEAWLQGMYFYGALCSVAPALHAFSSDPKPLPYAEKPYPSTKEEVEELKEERRKQKLRGYKAQFESWAERLELAPEAQENTETTDSVEPFDGGREDVDERG